MDRSPFAKKSVFGILALLCIATSPQAAKAGPLTFTATTAGLEASAVFTPVQIGGQDYIQIVISNNESNTSSAGIAVSSLVFNVTSSSDLNTASSQLAQISGTEINYQTSTTNPITDNGPFPNNNTHWGFNAGSTMTLATVGQYAYGGSKAQPTHLIAALGSTPNSSLVGSHEPSFDGSATFLISASGFDSNTALTTSNITNVIFGYGTSFEESSSGSSGGGTSPFGVQPSAAAPAPPSLVLLGVGGLVMFVALARSRRRLAMA